MRVSVHGYTLPRENIRTHATLVHRFKNISIRTERECTQSRTGAHACREKRETGTHRVGFVCSVPPLDYLEADAPVIFLFQRESLPIVHHMRQRLLHPPSDDRYKQGTPAVLVIIDPRPPGTKRDALSMIHPASDDFQGRQPGCHASCD